MASLEQVADKGKTNWKLRYYNREKKAKVVWIGDVSRKTANEVLRHVEELLASSSLGARPDASTVKWVNNLRGRLRATLAKHGLCDPELPRDKPEHRELGPFMDAYFASRTDWKPRTRDNYNQAKSWAVKYFGENKPIASITTSDVGKWLRWMKQEGLSTATISKHGKRFRSCLKEAVNDKLIESNPAVGHKLGSEVNPSRAAFVDQTMAAAILNACPNVDWKLIFALPRFAGLRCPTEVLGLRWEDLDWDRQVMQIHSVKTGFREVPMFKPLDKLLWEAHELAPVGSQFVVQRYRENSRNLRTHLERIAKKAGVALWPKTFVNLRSTCRTELQEVFPDHVINVWLGHSSIVAERHYLQTTAEHLAKAISLDRSPNQGNAGGNKEGNTGGNGHAGQQLSEATNTEKSQVIQVILIERDSHGRLFQHPRQGSNNQSIPQGIVKRDSLAVMPAVMNSSSTVKPFTDSEQLFEVLQAWDQVSPTIRQALASMASESRPKRRGINEQQAARD